jgi:CDP-paratose 2-epimerase
MNILITGGLGFIGVNAALSLDKDGHNVFILDNMSRKGNIDNYNLLNKNITFFIKDIRNFQSLEEIFKSNTFDVVIHLAGQVAVTTSVSNPREDFDTNCLGTFNILECLRIYSPKSILLYSSTNKVYGNFKSFILEKELRYTYDNVFGIDEDQNLDFHSPYGCSKGAADQYVRDYNRIYGLRTVVLRQSCIYGPNQFGIEDQGWVSWFSISSIFDKKFTIYGDGKQVRDILHVDDLINLYKSVINNIDFCSGKIYNVGGGVSNTLSLLELIKLLEKKLNKSIKYEFSNWRPGDQKVYVSDITKVKRELGWQPQVNVEVGITKLFKWVQENKSLLKLELFLSTFWLL